MPTRILDLPHAMSAAENTALRKIVLMSLDASIKQGMCPCCVARELVFAAIDIGYRANVVPLIAQVMREALDDIETDASKPAKLDA
jgi:hypothetical protein